MPDLNTPHERWFAWYPIRAYNPKGIPSFRWVWLWPVDRYYSAYKKKWIYSL